MKQTNKFKTFEITQGMFSEHNGTKLGIGNGKATENI